MSEEERRTVTPLVPTDNPRVRPIMPKTSDPSTNGGSRSTEAVGTQGTGSDITSGRPAANGQAGNGALTQPTDGANKVDSQTRSANISAQSKPSFQIRLVSMNVRTLSLQKTERASTNADLDKFKLWLTQLRTNNIDIALMQECRVLGQCDLDPCLGYKCFFSGGKTHHSGVGVAIKLSLMSFVEEIHFVDDRTLLVCMKFSSSAHLAIVAAYGPAQGKIQTKSNPVGKKPKEKATPRILPDTGSKFLGDDRPHY